jgi:hypothetical protein
VVAITGGGELEVEVMFGDRLSADTLIKKTSVVEKRQ